MQRKVFRLKHGNSPLANGIKSVSRDALPVLEHSISVEGEGVQVGTTRLFLRLSGCLVGCANCDTPKSWRVLPKHHMSLVDITNLLQNYLGSLPQSPILAITGGEPMHYSEQLRDLIPAAQKLGYKVWLETGGNFLDANLFSLCDFVSLDVKTPSTGAHLQEADLAAFKSFVRQFSHRIPFSQIKAVVADSIDLDWLEANFGGWLTNTPNRIPFVLTPAAPNKTQDRVGCLSERFRMITARMFRYNVRIIPQIHSLLNFP